MSKKWMTLARDGDVGGLLAMAERDPNGYVAGYQWLLVAADLGCDEAEEMADTLLSTVLKHVDDEGIAALHFEVGAWWVLGVNGLEVDHERGLAQMKRAKELGLSELAAADRKRMRSRLSGKGATQFERLFPERVAKKAPLRKR